MLDMLPRQGVLLAPIRAGKLGDPGGLVGAQLVIRAPDVVVELADLDTVPVEAVEVDVASGGADACEEVLQPPHGMGRRGYPGAAAPHAPSPQRLYAPEPLAGRELCRHVGLVRELGLVEGEYGRGVDSPGLLEEGVDVDVVPLHGDELERSYVGRRVGRPVVQP